MTAYGALVRTGAFDLVSGVDQGLVLLDPSAQVAHYRVNYTGAGKGIYSGDLAK